jgi:MFS family permease
VPGRLPETRDRVSRVVDHWTLELLNLRLVPRGLDSAIHRLAVARLVSLAGTQAAYIALIALIYDKSNGSGIWIAAALVAGLGARVVSAPWAGALGDYFDRRLVMIASDLAAATCFVALSQFDSLPLLVGLAAIAGVAEAPFGAASGALVAMLVPEDRRGWANGTLSMGTAGGNLIGAAFGGVFVATAGASGAFLINAGSFVASAALAVSIKGRFVARDPANHEKQDVWRGVRILVSERVLRLSVSSIALVALALAMGNVAEYPLFVSIGAGKVGFGIAVAAWGAGQIAGGKLASRLVGARLERLAIIAGCALTSVVVGIFGGIPVFFLIAALSVLGGLGNSLLNIGLVMSVQRWSPPEVQSRTFAAVEALANTAVGVSLIAGGLLLAPLGPRGVYLLAGGLGVLAVIIAFRIPREPAPLKLDEAPASESEPDRRESSSKMRVPKLRPA